MQVAGFDRFARSDCGTGFLRYGRVEVQAVGVWEVTQSLVGLEKTGPKVGADGLVIVRVLEDVPDGFFLVRTVFRPVSALKDSMNTLNLVSGQIAGLTVLSLQL